MQALQSASRVQSIGCAYDGAFAADTQIRAPLTIAQLVPESQSDGASHERTHRRPTEPPKFKHTYDAHAASLAHEAPSAASGLSHAPLVELQTSLPGQPVAAQPLHVPVAGAHV